jgi:hypothetical protein
MKRGTITTDPLGGQRPFSIKATTRLFHSSFYSVADSLRHGGLFSSVWETGASSFLECEIEPVNHRDEPASRRWNTCLTSSQGLTEATA